MMVSSRPAIFGLLDCNNFFVSCERVFQPSLEGRPVVVLSSNDGCVISRSNEAKALKIKMGEPIYQIKSFIHQHQVKCFSTNFPLYADFSRRVMETVAELVPAFEVYSIDEAFLDLGGLSPKEISSLGKKIIETIYRWTGIPVSLGIGPTKTLAKIANSLAKKHLQSQNIFIINEQNREHCLKQVGVEEVWGIGRQWTKKIQEMNIITAYQLNLENSEKIHRLYNKVLAATVSELQGKPIQGIETFIPPKKQIMVSRSFGRAVTDLKELKEAISFHLTRAMEKLRNQNSVAKNLTIFIQTNRFQAGFTGYYHPKNIELALPSHNTQEFLKLALVALEQLYCTGLHYNKAGVILSDISIKGQGQFDLFENNILPASHLGEAIDVINKKMGRGTVRYAVEGFEKEWQSRSMHCSSRYTTRWNELCRVKAF